MEQLQPAQFTAAVSELREEMRDELERMGLEVRALRRKMHHDFAIWLIDKDRMERDAKFQDVAWTSGGIATIGQLTVSIESLRAFVYSPAPSSGGNGLTM